METKRMSADTKRPKVVSAVKFKTAISAIEDGDRQIFEFFYQVHDAVRDRLSAAHKLTLPDFAIHPRPKDMEGEHWGTWVHVIDKTKGIDETEAFIEIRGKDGRIHPPAYLMFCLLHEFAHAAAPQDPGHGRDFYGALARILQCAQDLGYFRMPVLKGKDDRGRGKHAKQNKGKGKGKGKGKDKAKGAGGKDKKSSAEPDCDVDDELGDIRFHRKNVKACDGAELGTKKALPATCCPSNVKTKLSGRAIVAHSASASSRGPA